MSHVLAVFHASWVTRWLRVRTKDPEDRAPKDLTDRKEADGICAPNHYFERHSHQGSGNSLESCQRRCRLTGCRAISFAPGNCWLYGYACSSISLAAGVETYVPLDALAGTVAVNYELPARHFQLRRPTIKVRH